MGSSKACRIHCSAFRGCSSADLRLDGARGTLDLRGEVIAPQRVGDGTLLQFGKHGKL